MSNPHRHAPRAFALVELLVVILILVATCAVASLLMPDSRRRARLAGSIQNLQQLGKAAASFAADNQNRVFSLSWEPGVHQCGGYVFPNATTYNEAAAHQAVCILREHAGRTDITAISGWFPFINYNHLVLIDYLDDALPSPMLVSPGDTPRLAWQRAVLDNPKDPNTAYFSLTCRPSGSGNAESRWPYSSTYTMQPSFFSPDAVMSPPGQPPVPTVAQDPIGHRFFQVGTSATVLGNRRMDEVRFPANKAMLFERDQRFFGSRDLFCLYPEARLPMLIADGGAGIRSVNAANRGFQPNSPFSPNPTRVNYTPELSWETPTANEGVAQLVDGRMFWTRSGLRGRDFAGPEVPWVP